MVKLKSSFEGEIVKYYDTYFLPKEKVEKEVDYILDMVGSEIKQHDYCIDLGCGTGAYSHAISPFFNKVVGIDSSRDMVDYATKNHGMPNVTYYHEDARCMNEIDGTADLIISLAHVIGYQLDNNSVSRYLNTININLKQDGLVLLNFYNLSAIYLKQLEPRHVKMSSQECDITRISNAKNVPDSNCLALDYYYLISHDNELESIEIHEKMRYFSRLELEYYLNESGFEILRFFNYNDNCELTSDCWNGGVIARKVRDIRNK